MAFSPTDLVRGLRDFRPATVPVVMIAIAAAGIFAFLAIADEMAEGEIDAFDTALRSPCAIRPIRPTRSARPGWRRRRWRSPRSAATR